MLRLVLVLILIVFLARGFWQIVDGIVEGATGTATSRRKPRAVAMARDPVCGTFVVPERAVAMTIRGQVLYFCSTGCRDRYRSTSRSASTASIKGKTA